MNSDSILRVSPGRTYPSLLTLSVEQGDQDPVYFLLGTDTPPGFTIGNDSRMITWTNVGVMEDVNITVTLTDGKASSLWQPFVQYCDCQVSCGTTVCEIGHERTLL